MARAKQTAADKELEAMGLILRALDSLDGESIQRVLDYVFSRLSIPAPLRTKGLVGMSVSPPTAVADSQRARRPSIRDLKEEKQPESANQMAALVAYYLSEEADDEHRKETISTPDLEKYFKQAGFRLPRSLPQTLLNATAAGYFDAVGSGQYKLNPVGYNLVVHGLPRTHKQPRSPSKRPKKKSVVQNKARKSRS